MTFIQAALCGLIYWGYATQTPGWTVLPMFYYPLPTSLWVGIILGDIPTAVMCGAAIQLTVMGFSGAGGTVPNDKSAACIIPTAAVITSGMGMDMAIALSVPVGLLMAQLHTIRRMVDNIYLHMCDKYANDSVIKRGKFIFTAVILPQIGKLVIFWLPMTLLLYYGASNASVILDKIPSWITNGFSGAGKFLPALGMGITISYIGKRELLPFFFAGFFLTQYTHVDSIFLVMIAAMLAWLYTKFEKANYVQEEVDDSSFASNKEKQTVLTKKDLFKSYFWWVIGSEASISYERFEATGFTLSMLPALEKLYPNDQEAIRAGVKRHLQFFNTEQFWGSMIPGIALSMEEQKALGADIPDDAITSIKTGLMGPFAGIGDTIDWATIVPLVLCFFIPFGQKGYWWGAALPMIIIPTIFFVEGWFFFKRGYYLGTDAALQIMGGGMMTQVLNFMSIVGLTMVGGLSASYVDITTPLVIKSGEKVIEIQSGILDAIVPGILPLVAVMGVYFLLKSNNKALTRAMLVLIAVGFICGALGIIA